MSPKSNPTPESLRFHTILHQAEGMNATGVIVPDEILARLGKGKRPPVRISINGYEYRSTVGIMGGKAMVGVSADIRKETGLAGGDAVKHRRYGDWPGCTRPIPPRVQALASEQGKETL